MTTNVKLTKVLEYLIKNDEEKARELLHQVFIEKARAIHEELMSMDEEEDEDMDESMHVSADESMDEEMDETVGGSGDMGKDLTNEIEAMEDEIEFEETMTEDGEEEEVEVGAEEVEPADDSEASMDSVEDKMSDLEAALAALKAEFDKLENAEKTDSEEDSDEGEEVEVGAEEKVDEEMDETWELDEDFDDLAESLDLEVVEKDPLKANKTEGEVGSGSSGMAIDKNAKSPLPKSQTSRMGAEPVKTGEGGHHNGYNRETAPKVADMGHGDNRRKKASDGAAKVSKEGDSSALINKATSDGFGAINNTSPLTKGGQNLK